MNNRLDCAEISGLEDVRGSTYCGCSRQEHRYIVHSWLRGAPEAFVAVGSETDGRSALNENWFELTWANVEAYLGDRLLERVGDIARPLSPGLVALGGEPQSAATVARRPHGGLSFCTAEDERADQLIRATPAAAVLCSATVAERLRAASLPICLLAVANPRLEFARIAQRVVGRGQPAAIDPRAAIGPAVRLGEFCAIAPFAVLEDGAQIGNECRIGPNVFIGGNVRLGDRVRVDANAVIGGAGFGYERDERGELQHFPQLGWVEIGDDVDLGPHVCVDRGALGVTRIGTGSKVDDGVYVAHNVQIGSHCLVMAGVQICGSSTIGSGAELSPGCVVRDHVRVGENARIGLGAVVVKDVPKGLTVAGVPARAMARG